MKNRLTFFKKFTEANKVCLRKLDQFAVPKADIEDGTLSFTSAIGGIITSIFFMATIGVIIYYITTFFTSPSITLSQSQESADTLDFSQLTSDERSYYNSTYGLNLTINSTNFDFAIFFPSVYDDTLDILFNGQSYNPMESMNVYFDPECKLPFALIMSHFSATIVSDIDDPEAYTIMVPVNYLGNYRYKGEDGRLYGIDYLNNSFLGANFQIDIILELARSTQYYQIDFTPSRTIGGLSHIFFLYREYSYDSINRNIVSVINGYEFSYYPPGTKGADVNSCTQVNLSPNILEVQTQKGILDTEKNVDIKFSSWTVSSKNYLYLDLYGVCPENDQTPYLNGTVPFDPKGCISPIVQYQPFKIILTGSKFKTIINVAYSNITTLISLIGGTITLIMSILSGLGTYVNKHFYKKMVNEKISNNLQNEKLKQLNIHNLDKEQKSVLLLSIFKNKLRNTKNDANILRSRNNELDKLILEEIERKEEKNCDVSDSVASTPIRCSISPIDEQGSNDTIELVGLKSQSNSKKRMCDYNTILE